MGSTPTIGTSVETTGAYKGMRLVPCLRCRTDYWWLKNEASLHAYSTLHFRNPRTPSEERMNRTEPPAEGDWQLMTGSRVGEDE